MGASDRWIWTPDRLAAHFRWGDAVLIRRCDGELRATRSAPSVGRAVADLDDQRQRTRYPVRRSATIRKRRRFALSGLTHAPIDATKSIIGHGIYPQARSVAATLLQMRKGLPHTTHGLNDPIDGGLQWVQRELLAATVRHALSLSRLGLSINTAICDFGARGRIGSAMSYEND